MSILEQEIKYLKLKFKDWYLYQVFNLDLNFSKSVICWILYATKAENGITQNSKHANQVEAINTADKPPLHFNKLSRITAGVLPH